MDKYNTQFLNELTNFAESRYLKSVFLGHARASDLLDGFKSSLTDVHMNNTLQIMIDGRSANGKFYDTTTMGREQLELSGLINIGGCGLHILHGAFQTGVETAGWEIRNCSMEFFNCFLILLLHGQITSK